jgi:hypothetical protein
MMMRSRSHFVVCPNSRSNALPVGRSQRRGARGSHRLVLEMSDRQAAAIAAAIRDTAPVSTEVARLQGIALAGVFQIVIAEAGKRTLGGQSQDQIADELRPAIEEVLDDLDRWLAASAD